MASVGVVCGVAYSVCRSEGKDGSDDQEPQLHTHYKPLLDCTGTGLDCTALHWNGRLVVLKRSLCNNAVDRR